MKTLNGFYRGIICQNNDPEKLGRVKVFVPHLHLTLIDLDPQDYNKEFYFSEFGTNYNKIKPNFIDLTKYVEKIKMKLPWAEVSLPITGGGFSSFNSASNRASTSDSPFYVNQQSENNGENDDSTGAPAGALAQSYPPSDAFSSGSDTPNPFGSAYTAQSYYNAPKGMFGIPQVNTKVWLFFLEGNPNNPVVFGYSPSSSSYNKIYDETTYPNGYENNDPTTEADPQNLRKQARTAMNYPGGSLTFDGTNNNEAVSISHDGGSFQEFSNSGQSNLVVGRKQSLVEGDSNTTIKGSQRIYAGDTVEQIIGKDLNISVGPHNYAAAQRWKDAIAKIHAYKSLPEVQNADNSSVFSSPLAKKSGKNPECRACRGKDSKRKTYSGKSGVGSEENLNLLQKAQKGIEDGLKSFQDGILSFLNDSVGLDLGELKEEQFPKTENCPICKGTGESPSTMDGDFPKEDRKEEIGNLYLQAAQELFEAENEMGGDLTYNVGGNITFIAGDVNNDLDAIRINKQGSELNVGVSLDAEQGLYNSPVTSSTVEYNHVDKFPGGQVTFQCGNGVTLCGGSGGCQIETTGILSLYGVVTELAAEKLDLSSKSGMSISTGEVLSFNAGNMVIESSGQTCMKGNIAVDGNLMCTGGAMIQGEMFVQHITGPMEPQETDLHPELYGSSNSGSALKIGFLKNGQIIKMDIPGLGSDIPCVVKETIPIITTDGGQTGDADAIYVYPHQHIYRSIPMTLGGTYEESRKNAMESGMGGKEPVAASQIIPGPKLPNIPQMAPETAFGTNQRNSAKKISPLKFAAPTG
jgi:hypothetical protein